MNFDPFAYYKKIGIVHINKINHRNNILYEQFQNLIRKT